MGLWHSGQPALYDTIPLPADGDRGWTTVESVLVRFNTSLTPSGRYPVYSDQPLPYYDGPQKRIGYDAAVCIQKYEPWVIEAYNASTGSPSALRIVGKGNGSSTSLSPSGTIIGSPIANTRYLNTTGKGAVFTKSHDNSVSRMLRVNFEIGKGWDSYVPPPLVGPVAPLPTTSRLTPTDPTGRLFHRRRWTSGIHRTLSESVRHHPRTSRRGFRSTILCGVGTRCCTIVRGRDVSVYHFQAVATDNPPGTCLDPGDRRRTVRADITARCSAERIWALQLASAVSIPGAWVRSRSVHKD